MANPLLFFHPNILCESQTTLLFYLTICFVYAPSLSLFLCFSVAVSIYILNQSSLSTLYRDYDYTYAYIYNSKFPKISSTSEIFFKTWKIINLKTLAKNKEQLKRIKMTFISEPTGKIWGGLNGFCSKKFYQAKRVSLQLEN